MSELIPRLSFAELDPALADLLRPKFERLGYLGEFFQCTAHQSEALTSFHRLTEDLKRALPDNLTELVALSIARLMGNAYERVQHERLALKLGFSEAWVREVVSLKAASGGSLSEAETLVQRLAIAMVERKGQGVTDELARVIKAIGHAQAVGVLMLTGRYVMHALISNALALEPPVSSPLDGK